jgi:hypothetical protein
MTKNHLGYILYIVDFQGDKEITSVSISNILTQW